MSDDSLTRALGHLRALGFYLEPCTRDKTWLARFPAGGSFASLNQKQVKSLARACRHFPTNHPST